MPLFHIIAIFCIIAITFAGGYLPLFNKSRAGEFPSFPLGESFSAGIFLALALTMMLPSSIHILNRALPHVNYPIASVFAIAAFMSLLLVEHVTFHIAEKAVTTKEGLTTPIVPIIMTTMIAIPSFFIGTALGVSNATAGIFIFAAILTHKGSAGFALALKLARSTLSRKKIFIVFTLFALSTPLGIILGDDIQKYMTHEILLVTKGVMIAIAAGVFLYLGTLHDLRFSPLIQHCSSKKGFLMLILGFTVTAFVRYLFGEAHRF